MGVVLSDPRGSVTKHRYLKKKGSMPAMIPAPLVAGECVICDEAFKNKPLVLVLEYQPTGRIAVTMMRARRLVLLVRIPPLQA